MANFASFQPYFFRVKNVLFAEVEAYSVNVEGEEPRVANMAAEVFEFDFDVCDTVNVVILNDGLGVRKVILRINLRREARRKELSIRANAVKEFFNFGEVSSGDIEMNIIATESRRKRDILRGLQRFRLVERQRARNP